MRFYTKQHRYHCGIDLHARTMYLCILDQAGEVLLHRNVKSRPEAFLQAVTPYRKDLVVAVECIFTWYWLADLFGSFLILCKSRQFLWLLQGCMLRSVSCSGTVLSA